MAAIRVAIVLAVIAAGGPAFGYDQETHRQMAGRSAGSFVSSLDGTLKSELNDGILQKVARLRIQQLIGEGGVRRSAPRDFGWSLTSRRPRLSGDPGANHELVTHADARNVFAIPVPSARDETSLAAHRSAFTALVRPFVLREKR